MYPSQTIKNVALKGYSDETSHKSGLTEGYLFVQYRGTWQEGVPFKLWEAANEKILTVGAGSGQVT
jgi:hypothetical protein